MQIVGPQTFVVGESTQVPDPADAGGGVPSQAVQVQNSSPYQLIVVAAGQSLAIQSFTAQTVQITGAPVTVQPLAGTGTGPCSMTLVFLLGTVPNDGEQMTDGTWVETPPMTDGPLTAAAIATGLANAGIAGVSGLETGSVVAPAGAAVYLDMDALAPNGYQFWNWGFGPPNIGDDWPTLGGVTATWLIGVPAYAYDSLGWNQGASNRLAGLRMMQGNAINPGSVEFINYTDKEITCFVDFVPT